MKKLLALVALLVYMLNISSLVHASTMGFFHNDDHQAMGHCHEQSSSKQTPNMDCCELVVSSDYNVVDIKIKSVYKLLSFAISPVHIPTDVLLDKIALYKPDFSLHPGWDPDIKYQKFSDLMGIVVDLA
ncbi:MAG: hypothetical protein WCO66_05325 [Candidatus Absconditabacteria bacterium]